MRVLRFASTHFRNLDHDPIELSRYTNLFVGENGHGKTNILEAIYFFKFGRSFRTSRDSDMIHFDAPFCRTEVTTELEQGDTEALTASIERNGTKRVKLDGKEVARLSDLVGRYPCVLFGPQDLSLVSGFASERRRFLDMTGSMTDKAYLEAVRGYRRVLMQRNSALKRGVSARERRPWDEELVQRGCTLVARRMQLVEALRRHLHPHVEAMDARYAIGIAYESELTSVPEGVSLEENFAARLAAVEGDEARRRATLVGPHRDDLRILADGRDLRRYGSQGQRRLVAVLVRMAEMSYLEGELREPCVLLLDDLFSELDGEVSGRLKPILSGRRQIFVTSPVPLEWEGDTRPFTVHEGAIRA